MTEQSRKRDKKEMGPPTREFKKMKTSDENIALWKQLVNDGWEQNPIKGASSAGKLLVKVDTTTVVEVKSPNILTGK
jgi:hypothetical protein